MSKFKRFLWGLSTVTIVSLLVLGLFNLQSIADWWSIRRYTPPAAIEDITKTVTMTDSAKRIFYATHPELINEAATFRQKCPSYEQTIVLGCYRSGLRGNIYIYNVNDPRLSGVVEVTSAHEMLHAAYDRLESGEKSKINGQLSDYYTNKLKDERVLKVIEAYKKTEPTELLNEMHSIFATELNNLTPDLESYYRRYFENRTAVVGFANKYGDEFTRRIAQIEDYQKRLAVLKEKITQQEDSLRAQAEEIEADRRRLNDLRASGQFEEYNAAVLSFNARVNEYNSGVARLKSDIAEYNQLVRLHNELAAELRSLYDSLDTSLATQGAQ